MNIFSRRLLFGALLLILLLAACNAPEMTEVVISTATGQITDTAPPSSTSTGTAMPIIPITGMDVVSLQCQFCVNDESHAVLIMSSQASFNVSDPATGVICATAEEINGRRILLCRGAQEANFNLNVCVDASNCLQFPVTLQTCALIPQTGPGTGSPLITFTPRAPVFLTAINTLDPPASTPLPPTDTGVAPTSAITPPPIATSTSPLPTPPVPTEVTPQPTEPPPPTQPPATEPPTAEPSEDPPGDKKPSKTPKN